MIQYPQRGDSVAAKSSVKPGELYECKHVSQRDGREWSHMRVKYAFAMEIYSEWTLNAISKNVRNHRLRPSNRRRRQQEGEIG